MPKSCLRAVVAAMLLCAAGCGQKGPLYLPDKQPTQAPQEQTGDDQEQRNGEDARS